MPRPVTDKVGLRFGRLMVLERAPKPNQDLPTKGAWWKVRCDCGGESVILSGNLKPGGTESCGCLLRESARQLISAHAGANRLDLAGQRFGRLAALRPVGKRGRSWLWECRCDCGTTTTVPIGNLRSGHTVSCGCGRGRRPLRSVEVRAAASSRMGSKYRKDPMFRLNAVVRAGIHRSLKRRGLSKGSRTEALLGYSLAELRAHLEATTPAGHTWDDFLAGRLELDHVQGLETFGYQDAADPAFRAAWAMGNLQLLTVHDHRAKSAAATRVRRRAGTA